MNKLMIISLVSIITLFLLSGVSSMSVNYYYHPDCGHCKQIAPFMKNIISLHNNIEWNVIDTSKDNYNISGTPFIELFTDDNRKIVLSGSDEIPSYLGCEINEQSNINCETYSGNKCISDSWFIR